MSELSTLVVTPINRRATSDQQMIGGARQRDTSLPGAITWFFPQPTPVIVEGVASTVAGSPVTAQVWPGGAGHTLDVVHHAYIIFVIQGSNTLWAARQEDFAAIGAAHAVGKIAWVDGQWDLVPQSPGTGGPPPPPPIIIITSSEGGEDFPILFGSNPYVLHAGLDSASILSTWWTGFNGGGSYSPQIEGGSPGRGPGTDMEYNGQPEVYAYPTDWKTLEFGTAANRGDHWPLPAAQFDPADGQDYHVTTRSLDPFAIWQAWDAGDFGITVSPYGETPRFGSNAVWAKIPAMGVLGKGDISNDSAITPGEQGPFFISEVLCIRGEIGLPPLEFGATVLHVAGVEVTDGIFYNDFAYLNQSVTDLYFGGPNHHIDMGGGTSGATPYGTVFTADMDYTIPWWHWGAGTLNLLSFKVAGWYWNANSTFPFGNGSIHTTGGFYVDFAFTIDNHTHYAPPPDSWQTTGGVGTFVPATFTDPGPFGYIASNAIDLGNVGVAGRAYFRHEFTIPAATLHGAILEITAQTGIGQVYVNGTAIPLPVGVTETTDLWDAGRVLTLTIPTSDLVADGVTNNELAVQAYSASGPCRLVYKLTIS